MEGETILTQKLNVGMVSLGCDKNRVDAELMLGILEDKKYNIVGDEKEADVIIVNTCGFIESAKQESIDTILEMSKNKIEGRCKVLIASGCLAERYSNELLSEIPELDAVVGVGNYMGIEEIIDKAIGGNKNINKTGNIDYDVDFMGKRVLTTPSYTAYVKIAEGCNNNCSYCIIPKLRGGYRSRSMENVLEEIRQLSQRGTKEIILVAQDTTKYGIDIYGRKMLTKLIRKISYIQGVEWIRLLYCYPEDVDDELIEEISINEKVCKYLDIPIQHINDELLRRMRRLSNKNEIEGLIKKLRNKIPDIVIRTSFIVGFPGETDEQFEQLCDFVRDYKIDRVGVFTYSQEEDTDAATFEEQIDEKTKKLRQRTLLKIQQKISHSKNKEKIGKVYKVLVEGQSGNGMSVGRAYGDAPQIDGCVYIRNCSSHIEPGTFTNVKIVDVSDYDLLGEVCHESCE